MRYFFIASVLFSMSALACPDLSGKYLRCKSAHSSRLQVEIKQSVNEGIHVYRVNTFSAKSNEVYRADGRPDVVSFIEPNTGVKIEITTTSNCQGDNSLKAFRTFAFDGEVLGTYDVTIRKKADKLQITNFFKSPKQEFVEEIECLP